LSKHVVSFNRRISSGFSTFCQWDIGNNGRGSVYHCFWPLEPMSSTVMARILNYSLSMVI